MRNKWVLKGMTLLSLLFGISVMAYPFAANWWNMRHQGVLIDEYSKQVAGIGQTAVNGEMTAAQQYNEKLLKNVILTDPFDLDANRQSSEEYEAVLNVNEDGSMGYLEIPKINVSLMIYHGTGSDTLARGVGHMEHTSLPIGGISTHCVLSAHTGHPTAKYFDHLDQLEEGDSFFITVLDQKMAYRVDQVKVVEPEDTNPLRIEHDEDYVTLVTCTPYGVNSHRLLVRGTRIPYMEQQEMKVLSFGQLVPYCIIGTAAGLFILIIILKIRAVRRAR